MIFLYYVPILESIKLLLKFAPPNQCSYSSEQGFFQDIHDGDNFKSNALFDVSKISVIFYQDSLEIVNPLCSAKNKHKLLGVYFTLGNLPAYKKSNIDHMQLVMLCKDKFIKKYGIETIFRRVVNDSKELEEVGIQGTRGNTIKGTVFSIVGDNLGAHIVGGFNESFTSTYFCRYCLLSKNQFRVNSLHRENIRTYENTKFHLNSEENFGVKNNSIFNELCHFHVVRPGLPPCLGHDLFEGVVALDVMLCIVHFISKS